MNPCRGHPRGESKQYLNVHLFDPTDIICILGKSHASSRGFPSLSESPSHSHKEVSYNELNLHPTQSLPLINPSTSLAMKKPRKGKAPFATSLSSAINPSNDEEPHPRSA